MIFTSPVFILFFALLMSLYLIFRKRKIRHVLLLTASSVFYGWWDYRFLGLLWAVILVSFTTGLFLRNFPRYKDLYLGSALVILLAILGVFKYFNFFTQALVNLANQFGLQLGVTMVKIILPVGISFYIFQGVSYVVDVYRGHTKSESNILYVANYISFFPQLVAGPIVRASDFIPQMRTELTLNAFRATVGLKEFAIGFLYKSVFADNLAKLVDPVFGNIKAFDNFSLVAASFAFYSQIYFDFAGYSLMAIGIARILGYDFKDNFRYPYQASSVTEFWRRWHISLSTWLRDYLYIPLGGNRHGRIKQYRNLMTTMLLGGLWHGASWNFMLWGGLHGVALIANRTILNMSKFPGNMVKTATGSAVLLIFSWLITQSFVLLCWVPFRLPEFSETIEVFSAFINFRQDSGLKRIDISYALLLAPILFDTFLSEFKLKKWFKTANRSSTPRSFQAIYTCFIIGVIFAIALMLIQLNVSPFIYFQF